MAQTLAQIIRTTTTDFTDPTTKKTAQNAIARNMAAMENVSERELKAGQIVGFAELLASGVVIAAGTDYRHNYTGLAEQAISMMQPVGFPLDPRQKNMLDTTLAVNAGYYAAGTAGLLDINSGMTVIQVLRNYSAEELDMIIAFLRLKAGV